ncbi:restriction endonuclease subunit S [Dyella ginsengisoli]|uniref:Restriction endonuclease subunit S n=1 Tax=Dyella ginsengisoli TaxID=363848 RepID=A0ABW8JVG8_9GAMM
MTHPAARLGDLAEVTSGFAFKSEQFNTEEKGLPLVRIRDVVDGVSDTYYSGEYSAEHLVADGDALIGMDGQFNLACWRGGAALLNQRVCRVKAVNSRLDQSYLLHFLPAALKEIEDRTPFVTVKHLSVKALREIEVPLPPLAEQRRIAAILDKVDALRANRREAIAKLDQLLHSVFLDMFGDPATNPMGWPVGVIGDLLDSVKYGSSEKAVLEGEVPILRMNNITYSGEMDLRDLKYISASSADEKYLVRPGDILFNRTNSKELVGKTAVYDGPTPMAYAGYLVRGRAKSGQSPYYISGFMNSLYGKTMLQGMCKSIVGMANINAQEFKAIAIALPPARVQKEYESKIRSIKAQRDQHRSQSVKLDALFSSLQQQAFAGTL